MSEQDLGQALDWDMIEVDDAEDYVLIEPGEYEFQVISLSKERFEGSEKMAPCPKAVVGMSILFDGSLVTVSENLMLNTKMMFKISQFFKSLGAKADPETGKVPVDWSNVIGKTGRVEIEQRAYIKKDGSEGKANSVKRFIAADAPSAGASEKPSAATGGHGYAM